MTPPKVCVDFEFGFQNGQATFASAEHGRDRIVLDESKSIRLVIHPDEQTTETVEVFRAALAYTRMTERQAPAESPEDIAARLADGADIKP